MALDLDRLKDLQDEWRKLQPLSSANDERLWLKLRLEWNYHSNHIEGNTLTYGETKAFLLHDEVSGSHSGREYEEMKGHDLAIKLVRELAASPSELTEADVRGLNKILLKESFYKEAITPSGESTRKLVTPGQYKQEPNSVRTATGELFEYAAPVDVPARMAKLVEVIRNMTAKDGLEFFAALALAHHEFTLIHPFDDGNGRVARLLTNYSLLKKGLPPIVIRSQSKAEYLSALRKADGHDPKALMGFFTDNLVWSFELGIKAGKGESLEEPSDVEKEIELFVREQKQHAKQIHRKSAEVLNQWLQSCFRQLVEKVAEKTNKIEELFESKEIQIQANPSLKRVPWSESLNLNDLAPSNYLPDDIRISVRFNGYTGKADHPFGVSNAIVIELDRYEYHVIIERRKICSAVYAEMISFRSEDEIISLFLKGILDDIKKVMRGELI
jgi:hypothetical protein